VVSPIPFVPEGSLLLPEHEKYSVAASTTATMEFTGFMLIILIHKNVSACSGKIIIPFHQLVSLQELNYINY